MRLLRTIAIPLSLLVLGVAIMLYPLISNAWNSAHASLAIQSYDEACHSEQNARLQQIWDEAVAYNQHLLEAECGSNIPASLADRYEGEMAVDDSGVMGSVEIFSIGVKLPIYHGTSEGSLAAGVGHVEWSSLPVGGAGSHCVIAGHTGLPSATLFSHLDRLKPGDMFTISCLGRTLYYKVEDTRVVAPDDASALGIVQGQDLCTLLTCTPYGINTYRLLVRGVRVADADVGEALSGGDADEPAHIGLAGVLDAMVSVLFGSLSWRMYAALVALLVFALASVMLVRRYRRMKHETRRR